MKLNLLVADDAKELESKNGSNTTPNSHSFGTLKIKGESGLGQRILKGRDIKREA